MELSGDLDMLIGEHAELGCWWCAAQTAHHQHPGQERQNL
jgi:hypothetical protein